MPFFHPCPIDRAETQSRERVLSDSELPQFWAEFDKAGVDGMALKLILLTGQRPGEVCAMRYEHIVDCSRSRNGSIRSTPIIASSLRRIMIGRNPAIPASAKPMMQREKSGVWLWYPHSVTSAATRTPTSMT
jgi:integrase